MQFGLENEYEVEKQKASMRCFALTMNYANEKLEGEFLMSDLGI